jgi:hypothetical protein
MKKDDKMAITISKSAYIRGLQCYKSLFLEKNHSELKQISPNTQALFDTGNAVGSLARDLFPGGVTIPYIPCKGGQEKQLRLTQEAIENGAEIIYEAAFAHVGKLCKVDILVKVGNGWNLFEVKSGTSADAMYLEDVAFQHHVLTSAGIRLNAVYLAYINNKYVREGELDLQQLFNIEDVTEYAIERESFVNIEHTRQLAVLAGTMPTCGIGKQCNSPYECDFKGHCWKDIPEDSVFDIRGNGVDKFSLYNQGIIRQADIPAEILATMNAKQRQQVECTRNGMGSITPSAIKNFLDGLIFPLCFFDVETFVSAVPRYDGMKPYQQTAFQYSLHILHESGDIEHREFLAVAGIDPRESFITSLVADMPTTGTVIAFNKSFECSVLLNLAKRFPEFGDQVNSWVGGMADLMVPFRQRDVYFASMKGSYSIKYVLPALCQELSYEGFEIANGQAAMDAYNDMCKASNDPKKLATIRANLLKYCHLDTFGMVKILEVLRFFGSDIPLDTAAEQ